MIRKNLNGIFLVAGTSIGGGMLALPMTASKLGLITISLYFIIVAVIMTLSGLILIPLYKKEGPFSIANLAAKKLGNFWGWLATFSLGLLLYALLVAYLSGLSDSLASLTSLSSKVCLILITLLLVLSLTFSSKIIEIYNKVAFSIKIIILLAILLILGGVFQLDILQASLVSKPSGLLTSLPILVTSFGFHGSAPFLFKRLGPDHYKRSVIIGISCTLLIYFSWIFLILGFLPSHEIASLNLEEFLSILDSKAANPLLIISLKIFYNLAIATSLFGVAVGLFDFLEEKLPKSNRLSLAGLVFLLPMIFNLLNKNLFFQALNFAGIVLTFIAIILPSFIALKEKTTNKALLFCLIFFSFLVIFGEVITLLAL